MKAGCLVAVLLVAGALALPAPAHAGCAAAVVVDGRVLFDLGPTRRDALPPRGSPHDAISPACNDGGPPFEADGDTTVVTLAGIPPDIAVVDELGTTYVADGSLVATGAHPLHLAVHGARDRPSARTGRTCRPGPTVRGRAVSAGPDGITFDDDRVVRVDAATRIANRPAYEPVAAGQPLAVDASRCGRQLVADSVRFEGATVRPARYERFTAGAGGTHGWWIALMLALAVGLVAGMGRIVLGPRP